MRFNLMFFRPRLLNNPFACCSFTTLDFFTATYSLIITLFSSIFFFCTLNDMSTCFIMFIKQIIYTNIIPTTFFIMFLF